MFNFCEELLEEWQFESKSEGCAHEATYDYCYSQACLIIIIIIIIIALQLFMQSFDLLNQFLPSSSIPDKGLPIWHFWLLYIFSNIIFPACLWSSYWLSWNGFPGVYCLDHSCCLHPFNVTKPSKSLCSNEVYYVLVFYYFIQFLVGFYSPNTVFIGWAKYFRFQNTTSQKELTYLWPPKYYAPLYKI